MGLKESGLRASVRSVSTVVPAFFDVAITDTNSPVNEGDVLVVDYSVDNTGDSFETQDIRLEIESVQEDADLDVSLSGGASDSGTLEWDTTGQDADTYEATVLSDDDSDTVTVEIPDAFFDVAIQSTNSPVEEGETLNVDYLVDNTGGVEDTQDIRLEIDNTQEDVDTDVTLDSDTSTTGTLQWDTTDESADTYSATVLSDDDSDSVTVEIESAISDSVVDWTNGSDDLGKFSGSTSEYDVNQNSPTIDSGWSLKNTGSDDFIGSVDGDGLNRYPEQGQRFACYAFDEGGIPVVMYGVPDNSSLSGYGFWCRPSADNVRLSVYESGNRNDIINDGLSYEANTWYDLDVSWGTDNTHTISIYEVDQSTGERESEIYSESVVDDTFAGELGVGFYRESSSGDPVYGPYRIL